MDWHPTLPAEDEAWQSADNLAVVDQLLDHLSPLSLSVLDVGCGTGITLFHCTHPVLLGIEQYPPAVLFARARNPTAVILEADVRAVAPGPMVDAVLCKAFLKHFSLAEWPAIFTRVASWARHQLCFTMNVGPESDDGEQGWHHTTLPLYRIEEALWLAGFTLTAHLSTAYCDQTFIGERRR